jgi:hypothetical protein
LLPTAVQLMKFQSHPNVVQYGRVRDWSFAKNREVFGQLPSDQ